MIDRRPGMGSGSCARCRGGLVLDAVKRGDVWYCSPACSEGRLPAEPSRRRVPEPRLYNRPVRFFRARRAKELC